MEIPESINTFTFDDISIVPTAYTEIRSRNQVDTSCIVFGCMELDIPLISASMSVFDVGENGKISLDFAREMYYSGGVHIFSRRSTFSERILATKELSDEGIEFGISVSLEEFKAHRDVLENLDCVVSVDVANGAVIPRVEKWDGAYSLLLGNFGNPDISARKDGQNISYKFGVGGGSACTTRMVTGVGPPQAWLVHEASYSMSEVISDGGINSVGDFCKVLALGADAVMVGKLLAAASETPQRPVKVDGKWYKNYYGEASLRAKGKPSYVEGIEGLVPYTDMKICEIVSEFKDGLRSCMTYVGVEDVHHLPIHTAFVRVPPTAVKENGTRIYVPS